MTDTPISHDDLVTLTRWMADEMYTAKEIADAVEKPYNYRDLLNDARAWYLTVSEPS